MHSSGRAAKRPAARTFVTVVSGLPRSGSSLMMQMLGAGGLPLLVDDARGADLDNPHGYFEYAPVRHIARDASWLELASGHAVKVVCPLATLLPAEPAYRFVVMRRDLAQVLASQRAMLARRGADPGGPSDARLVEILRAQLAELESWAQERSVPIFNVDYAGLVAEPERVSRALAEFLGGGLEVSAMASVVDPALFRQRER